MPTAPVPTQASHSPGQAEVTRVLCQPHLSFSSTLKKIHPSEKRPDGMRERMICKDGQCKEHSTHQACVKVGFSTVSNFTAYTVVVFSLTIFTQFPLSVQLMPSGRKAASQVSRLERVKARFSAGLGEKRQLIKDYAAMIANIPEIIHCVVLSYRRLSLLIRGLTSTFAADEGASPLLNSNTA